MEQQHNPQPIASGQWRTVTIGGRQYLAHLQVELIPEGDQFVVRWVAVVYRDPNASARYVRGESLESMDDAIAAAGSLMRDLPQPEALPEPVLTKLALPDGTIAALTMFPSGVVATAIDAAKAAEISEFVRVREAGVTWTHEPDDLGEEGALPESDEALP